MTEQRRRSEYWLRDGGRGVQLAALRFGRVAAHLVAPLAPRARQRAGRGGRGYVTLLRKERAAHGVDAVICGPTVQVGAQLVPRGSDETLLELVAALNLFHLFHELFDRLVLLGKLGSQCLHVRIDVSRIVDSWIQVLNDLQSN